MTDCIADAGFFIPTGGKPTFCPANSGTGSRTGSTSKADCKADSGYTGEGRSVTACEAGTYKNAAASAAACSKCEKGKYAPVDASRVCGDCGAGTFSAHVASRACDKCPSGKSASAGSQDESSCLASENGETVLQAGLSWHEVELPLIACCVVIVLYGCLMCLNSKSTNGADYTALLKAVMIVAEMVVDALTTESLSHDPGLLTLYVLMIMTLLVPMIIKVYILISFLKHQGDTKDDFREWLAANNSVFVSVVYVLMILKLDAFVLLKCRVCGMRCFSAPLDADAIAYLQTRGTIDLCMENLPQMILAVMIAAHAGSGGNIASLLFFQFCISGLGLLFNMASRIAPCLQILMAHGGSKRSNTLLQVQDGITDDGSGAAYVLMPPDVIDHGTEEEASVREEGALSLAVVSDIDDCEETAVGSTAEESSSSALTFSEWLSAAQLAEFEGKLLSDAVGVTAGNWREDVKELDVETCKCIGMSIVQSKKFVRLATN